MIKIKRGGAYVDAIPFVKRSGAYAAVSAYVKSGGAYLAAGEPEQVIEPFAVGTLSFVGASIDEQALENGNTAALRDVEYQFTDNGIAGVTAYEDASSGRSISALRTSMPGLITTILSRPAPRVALFANILGNDVSGSLGAYGRPELAPHGYWEQRIADLDYCVQMCRDNGIRPIVTNTSWRNYGGDDSCRTDEDKGCLWVDINYLHPYIKASVPECWDFASDKPMIDCYTASWNVAQWFYSDDVHPNSLGRIWWRRFLGQQVAQLASGRVPDRVGKMAWPIVVNSGTVPAVRLSLCSPAATTIPAAINKFGVTNVPLKLPALKTIAGVVTEHWAYISHQTNWDQGRGNSVDISDDITNNEVAKFNAYGSSRVNLTIGGLPPLEAVTLRVTSNATFTATAGDRVSRFTTQAAAYQDIISDEAPGSTVLTFDTVTTPDGYVMIAVEKPAGATRVAVSGLEVVGRSV